MNPALETLMLVFSGDAASALPGRALFIGAEPHADLARWPEVTGWQPSKPRADAWERAGFSRTDEIPDTRWPLILVLPGKSRDEALFWFSVARNHLEPGGRIVAAMPNIAGAGRFEKELTTAAGNILSIQKHKCRAFHAAIDGRANERIFTEWRTLGEPRVLDRYMTRAGIFSSDHIDPGSQLLADHLPAHLRGNAADLGAGWGFLSDTALKRCPNITRLDLFEADARAMDCARGNVTDPRAFFHWHDVTAGLPGTYDTIIMNPPFHASQATDVDLGRAFLKVACASLNRGGKLLMVANRQLPYEAALEASGLVWRKTVEDKTYKLLSAEKR